MRKQLTIKRDDTQFQSLVRAGNVDLVMEMISNSRVFELKEMLFKRNQSGEAALYIAAENGHVDLVKKLIDHHDLESASTRARNGLDAFHIAAKQGHLEVLKVLMEAIPELSTTCDPTNTTALHTAASQGHIHVVNYLLEQCKGIATVAKTNEKTALHSAARNGHVEIVKAILRNEPGIATRTDRKGQTALHMAVKGFSVESVNQLLESEPFLINMIDSKGNTALHIATRKSRAQIVQRLLIDNGVDKAVVNNSGETAFDIAEKAGNTEIKTILQEHRVQRANSIKPVPKPAGRELKAAVSEIKHEVNDHLEHTRETRKRVHGIAKRLNKMHSEGLNNAINSTTVVAVLIATVAFAAIFNIPGQYADDPDHIPSDFSLGQANIAPKPAFLVFFIFDAIALFISLAVVVVQTSIVVIERKAKKQMMAIINKLMWLACIMVSVAFLALSYIVVGDENKLWAAAVTSIGGVIMVSTLGTLCYWVILQSIEAAKLKKNSRRSSMNRSSRSMSMSMMSDPELLGNEFRKLYAV